MTNIQNSDQFTNESTESTERIPDALAKEILKKESAIRQFLGNLLEKQLCGHHGQIRTDIRAFSQQNPMAFKALWLTFEASEDFFDDIQSTNLPDGTVETLRTFEDDYGELGTEFSAVASELIYDMENPWPSPKTTVGYSDEQTLPLMQIELKSGDVTLTEIRVPISQILGMVDILLAQAGELIENVNESGLDVNQGELEQIVKELDDIEETFAETRSHVDDPTIQEESKASGPAYEPDSDSIGYYFN